MNGVIMSTIPRNLSRLSITVIISSSVRMSVPLTVTPILKMYGMLISFSRFMKSNVSRAILTDRAFGTTMRISDSFDVVMQT